MTLSSLITALFVGMVMALSIGAIVVTVCAVEIVHYVRQIAGLLIVVLLSAGNGNKKGGKLLPSFSLPFMGKRKR